MSITTDQYARVFRTLPLPVTYFEGEEEKSTVLNIKYRPIKQEWIDQWRATSDRLSKDVTAQTAECISSAFNAAQGIINVSSNGSAPQTPEEKALFLASLLAVVNARMELTDEQKEEAKRLKAAQLSTILLDVDMIDPSTKAKVKPTEDFLVTLDLELLNEVGDGILKKTFQVRTI